jgi:hypothetical protein
MTPNTSLAVEGSRRTLIWVEVMPSIGTEVGSAGVGSGVVEGRGAAEDGSVDVPGGGVIAGVISPCMLEAQPVPRSARVKALTAAMKRLDTIRF